MADDNVTDEVTVPGHLSDAEITMRTSPAAPGAGQNWPDVHNHAAADEQARVRNISFPEGNLTIAQKQAILNGESIDQEVK